MSVKKVFKKKINYGEQEEIFHRILNLTKSKLTNKEIKERLSLSNQQFRRCTAELVDKGLLKNYGSNGKYLLTAKGNIHLKNANIENTGKKKFLLDAYDLSREIIYLKPEDTLLDARNFMLRYNISRIIISKNQKPIGIITEKDISNYLYETYTEKKLSEVLVREIMKKNLLTVSVNSEIKYCTSLILKNNLSSIILVDDIGRQQGIVTKSDLVELFAYHYGNQYNLKDWMTSKVLTVDPLENIHMILLLMNIHNISRIVVVQNGSPVGIITARDLLPISFLFQRKINYSISQNTRQQRQPYIPTKLNSIILAENVMNESITVLAKSDLAQAAKIMIRNEISGLPVVNPKNKLVGIITKTDIVKALDKMLREK